MSTTRYDQAMEIKGTALVVAALADLGGTAKRQDILARMQVIRSLTTGDLSYVEQAPRELRGRYLAYFGDPKKRLSEGPKVKSYQDQLFYRRHGHGLYSLTGDGWRMAYKQVDSFLERILAY